MAILEQTINRLKFFRDIQLWPLASELDFENWLDNFETVEDKELAAQVLRFFIYIPEPIENQMLRTVVGKCGYYFKTNNPHWEHRNFKDNCWYSFIQGENKEDITDSGYLYPHRLRDELGISWERIVKFDRLFEILEDNIGKPQNVILIDDFVGTGAQTDTAWNTHKCGKMKMTLNEHVKLFKHNIVYAPLVVNEMGYNRILKKCAGLHLEYVHLLNEKYSILNKDGLCWNGDKDKFDRFCDMLDRVAIKENIPKKSGNSVNDMLGFGRQGLALAFKHGIPDACPAFFYWNTDTWKPLRIRPYKRH